MAGAGQDCIIQLPCQRAAVIKISSIVMQNTRPCSYGDTCSTLHNIDEVQC